MKIEKSIYEGYLWYSNSDKPKLLKNEDFELEISDNKNPFVIEGQLYDRDKMKSISIKYVDGQYICNSYAVDPLDFNRADVERKEFYSNWKGGDKLQFLQYWGEVEDDLCEGLKVLRPEQLVFVGFIKE